MSCLTLWFPSSQDAYVYPNKFPDAQKQQMEEDRERERKGKDDRPRPKEMSNKEEGKDGADPRTSVASSEDHRGPQKDPRPNTHMQFPSTLAQHQPYVPYMHGYPYSQGYDPNHPGYRGIMMQNYPGKQWLNRLVSDRVPRCA